MIRFVRDEWSFCVFVFGQFGLVVFFGHCGGCCFSCFPCLPQHPVCPDVPTTPPRRRRKSRGYSRRSFWEIRVLHGQSQEARSEQLLPVESWGSFATQSRTRPRGIARARPKPILRKRRAGDRRGFGNVEQNGETPTLARERGFRSAVSGVI